MNPPSHAAPRSNHATEHRGADSHGPDPNAAPHPAHTSFPVLVLGALGVVYGDIGTSPLYAVNEIFFGHGNLRPEAANVTGAISLVVWTLSLVIAFKYAIFVLRADNDGEGGTFALYGLLHQHGGRATQALLLLIMLAAGLLFGEGVITPAISVLSAVEGLAIVTPALERGVVPLTVVILTGLFAIQRRGTAQVGRVFGPLVLVWFLAIGSLGASQIARHPEILGALNPLTGVRFLVRTPPSLLLLVLGGVVLAITGGEALFADMGHFGKKPIRVGWFSVVYPALLLSYLGQGAYLLGGEPVASGNVFYSMVPRALLLPMVILATGATIIASQALISGAFSLAAQAAQLGLFPRVAVVHTHHAHEGQIYVPFINWALWTGCVTLAISFRSSSALAAAYGLSVSGVMLTTSLSLIPIARRYWKWSYASAALVFLPLAAVDATFLGANSLKLFEGGYIPLGLGVILFNVMLTWRWGRKATFAAYTSRKTMTLKDLIELKRSTPRQLERNVLFMVPKRIRSERDSTPVLFQLFWERFGVLPRNVFFIEVVHRKVPHLHDQRYHVTVLEKDDEGGSIVSVEIAFGFMEDPNVERVLAGLARHHQIDLSPDPHNWVMAVSQEHVHPAKGMGWLGRARLRVFGLLRQISQPSYYFYGLGDEVQLSVEIMPVRIR